MWINNYDDPEELTLEEAKRLLVLHGYKTLITLADNGAILQHPFDLDRIYFCLDTDDIVDLAIGESLTFSETPLKELLGENA